VCVCVVCACVRVRAWCTLSVVFALCCSRINLYQPARAQLQCFLDGKEAEVTVINQRELKIFPWTCTLRLDCAALTAFCGEINQSINQCGAV
jgi:hypothetical protein